MFYAYNFNLILLHQTMLLEMASFVELGCQNQKSSFTVSKLISDTLKTNFKYFKSDTPPEH